MKATKNELINSINWNKSFDDLSDDEKVNFCELHGFSMLPGKNSDMPLLNQLRNKIEYTYKMDQSIVDDRGTERLAMYI